MQELVFLVSLPSPGQPFPVVVPDCFKSRVELTGRRESQRPFQPGFVFLSHGETDLAEEVRRR